MRACTTQPQTADNTCISSAHCLRPLQVSVCAASGVSFDESRESDNGRGDAHGCNLERHGREQLRRCSMRRKGADCWRDWARILCAAVCPSCMSRLACLLAAHSAAPALIVRDHLRPSARAATHTQYLQIVRVCEGNCPIRLCGNHKAL